MHFVHCNIKLANFLISTDRCCNDVYIIDFGLAQRYRDPRTHIHIPFQEDYKILTGTTTYASLNNHCGVEHSRCDNLESLAYVLIYFLRGTVPWSGTKTSTKKQRNKIMQMKLNSDLLNGWPDEFSLFLNYARTLPFESKPAYTYLCKLFHDLRVREGCQHNYIFDWHLPWMDQDDCGLNPSVDVRANRKPMSKENENEKAVSIYSDRVYVSSHSDLNR